MANQEMTKSEALEIFGTTEQMTPEQVKLKYRVLAIKAHPDTGGSHEEMIKLTAAYKVLVQNSTVTDSFKKWKEEAKERKEIYQEIVNNMSDQFDLKEEEFISHIKSILGEDYQIVCKYKDRVFDYGNGASFSKKFVASRGEEVSRFEVTIWISDFLRDTDKLRNPGSEIPVGVTVSLFHDNKNLKLTATNYKMTDNYSDFLVPEKLFPSDKILKKFEKNKEKGLRRADFEAFFRTEFDKYTFDKDMYHLYFEDGRRLVIFRLTYQRLASYGINGLYQGSGGSRIEAFSTMLFGENREGMDSLRTFIRYLKDNDIMAAKTYLNSKKKA